MNKEQLEIENENLLKILHKLDSVISLNQNGKFIIAHEKIIGTRQMVLNSITRIQRELEIIKDA